MKKIIPIGALLLSTLSCNTNSDYSPIIDVRNDSLRMVIDSIRLANSKNSYIGTHTHSNLAAQAHQNPVKKDRMTINNNKIKARRNRKRVASNLARNQKLIDFGIIKEDESYIEMR